LPLAIRQRGTAAFQRAWLILTALALVACKTTPFSAQENIVQLHLMTVPVALDLDGRPGADGVSVKVYAAAKDNPKQVAIRKGALDVLMFDGAFQRQHPSPPILKQFHFLAEDLRRVEFTAELGKGYQLSLRWGTNTPTQRVMSVAARYTAPDGRVVLSRPSSITVLAR
jgi:hypothetical protein